MALKRRKFLYTGPLEFYADNLVEAENILIDGLEEDRDERILTPLEIQGIKEDQAYQDHKEAI